MDADRFDRLTVSLTRTRRSLLGLLSALGVTGLLSEEVLAACAENGTRCGRAGDEPCCSGRCVRKRGTRKKFCRQAPGQGICTVESPTICAGGVTYCHEPDTNELCTCFVTSRGYSFCGGDGGDCFACETDTNCEPRVGGRRGDRCIECAGCGTAFNNRACYSKCPNPA